MKPDDPNDAGSHESSGYIPTDDDFAPSPPKVRSPLSYWPDRYAIRPALLGLALFCAFSSMHWHGSGASPFTVSGAAVFERHEYYRLVTALFTHADLGHLLANTPLFLIFGWALHAYFGGVVFPIAALVIGVLSNLVTVASYAPTAQLLGASGMLYGMVSLWLVLYVRFDTGHTWAARVFRAVAVALLLLFPTTFHQTTSYMAHAAGFVMGLAVGGLLAPFVKVRGPQQQAASSSVGRP